MGNEINHNSGPHNDGRHGKDPTPSTDNSTGMASHRATLAVPSTISGLISSCVETIALFPWARGQEGRIEASIKNALAYSLDWRANQVLRVMQIDAPITQEVKDALKPRLLLEAPNYREHSAATEAALDVAGTLIYEHYGKELKQLSEWVTTQVQAIVSQLGENGRMSASELCEKLDAQFPPPVGSASDLTPQYLCLEMAVYGDLDKSKRVYKEFNELRNDTKAIDQATQKELSIRELLLTIDALDTLLGATIRQERTDQERLVRLAIAGKIPWQRGD